MIRPRPPRETSTPCLGRFRCVCLVAALVGLAVCLSSSPSPLKGQTPSKEYIRLGGRVIAIESPVVTGVSPTSQHFYGGGGGKSALISADSTTTWTATASATWIFITSSSSGAGPQTLLYLVTANTAGAAARSGTITVSFSTGQNATLSINQDALSAAPPTVTLLNSPPNGVYPSLSTQQTVTFQASSPNGSGYISQVNLEINNNIYIGGDDCSAIYSPSANILYLVQYDGTLQGYTLGSSGTASNYHCIINLSASSATTGDTSVMVTLVVTLQPSAVGTQNVYLFSYDNPGDQSASYGVSFGTWLAYNELTTNPPTVSMVSPVTTATSQVLYFKFSDGNGFRYIDTSRSLTVALAYDDGWNNAPCVVNLSPTPPASASIDQVVGGVQTYLGSGLLGSGGMIGAGGPCAIDLTNSKVHVNPNPALPDPDPNASLVTDIYLDLSVTLASTAPPVNIYAILLDRAGRGSPTPLLVTQWP